MKLCRNCDYFWKRTHHSSIYDPDITKEKINFCQIIYFRILFIDYNDRFSAGRFLLVGSKT